MERSRVLSTVLLECCETQILSSGFQALHDKNEFDPGFLEILYSVNAMDRQLNIVNPPKSESVPTNLLQSIRSVQYYLLSRDNYDEVSESGVQLLKACRLGVLMYVGFIQNDFFISPMSSLFVGQLKACLQNLERFGPEYMRPLHLWLLLLAGPLVIDHSERPWFVLSTIQAVSQLSLSSWPDVKALLHTFAWAEKIQDKPGRGFWDEAVGMQSAVRDLLGK